MLAIYVKRPNLGAMRDNRLYTMLCAEVPEFEEGILRGRKKIARSGARGRRWLIRRLRKDEANGSDLIPVATQPGSCG